LLDFPWFSSAFCIEDEFPRCKVPLPCSRGPVGTVLLVGSDTGVVGSSFVLEEDLFGDVPFPSGLGNPPILAIFGAGGSSVALVVGRIPVGFSAV
jgi:hypothetical protein